MADSDSNTNDAPAPPPSYAGLVGSVRQYHGTISPKDLAWRQEQLKGLQKLLAENETAFHAALKQDLGKSDMESFITETGFVAGEIKDALKNLKKWAKPQKVSVPAAMQPATAEVQPEPLGVALIIGAWNYPVQLTLGPLVAAIAAGNAAIIKPSEVSPATAKLLADLLPRYLDQKAFRIVEGSVPETTALLKEKFDKIFFTGSRRVGEIVMKAAAAHVTSVTLELGGKSPCIVDKSADLKVTAERIVFGKFTNAGQTCVAPDYILVDESVAEPLTQAIRDTLRKFYGEDPKTSGDYARIVNRANHERLVKLMESSTIAAGGQHDADTLYIAPTLLTNVDPASPIMQEEIFGPILPILPVKDMAEAFNFVAAREKPLSAYIFTEDKKTKQAAQEKISTGGMCINDTIVHPRVTKLPFGGTGGSGFGKYHGEWGFREFSNMKAVFNGSTAINLPVRYPPFTKLKKSLLKLFLR